MSTCISQHGEFSEHDPNDDWFCNLCGAFDETGVLDALKKAEAKHRHDALQEAIERIDSLAGDYTNGGQTLGWRGARQKSAEAVRALWAAWKAAYRRKEREGTGVADAAEQVAYDELVDYVEAHDLNGTDLDPRGPEEGGR